jgi:hypothetical protein
MANIATHTIRWGKLAFLSKAKSLKTSSRKTVRLTVRQRLVHVKEANSRATFSEDTQMRVGKQL